MSQDTAQTMPSLKDLVETKTNAKHWLVYYRNIWVRNLTARTIDLHTDYAMAKVDPKTEVMSDDGRGETIFVTERIERRKMLCQDALDLIKTIDELLNNYTDKEEDFANKYWSKEALTPALFATPETPVTPSDAPKEDAEVATPKNDTLTPSSETPSAE